MDAFFYYFVAVEILLLLNKKQSIHQIIIDRFSQEELKSAPDVKFLIVNDFESKAPDVKASNRS